MKTRLEELHDLLIDANCEADEAIINGADRFQIWNLIEKRTKLILEVHDLTHGNNHYEHMLKMLLVK